MVRPIVRVLLGLIFLLGISQVLLAYPAPRGYVNDFAGVITAQDAQQITRIAQSLRETAGIELAVVTIDSLDGMPIAQYGIELAEAWGVGRAGDDSGIILLFAPQERQVRIEVGYGLEGDIPDGLAGEILDVHVIPALRNDAYSQAMLEGIRAIAATLAEKRGFDLAGVQASQYAVSDPAEGGNGFSYFYFLLFLLLLLGRGRLWPLLFLTGRRTRHYHRGGFGSTPRGGGFGGFGGGGFGGGGASRSF